MATQLEIVKVKFSEMDAVSATPEMEVVGLHNGVNARTSVSSIVSQVTKTTIGLDKVANLAPADLPLSTADIEALAGKIDKGSIVIADVAELQTALDAKLDKTGTIEISQVNQLETRLEALAPTVVLGRTTW